MNLFSLFEPKAAVSGPFNSAADSPGRTPTSGMPMDTRREITPATRTALIKKSRWLYNNLGLIRRMVNGVARYAVGPGVVHVPSTGNSDFDATLDRYFSTWADNAGICDVRRKSSFWKLQQHAVRCMLRDGESFLLKAPEDSSVVPDGLDQKTMLGRPRVQWLETQSIGNLVPNPIDPEGFEEGIKFDAYGAALSFRMIETPRDLGQRPIASRVVPADSMIHMFDCERASQSRGIPWLSHGENSALDILDLTSLEKHAVKLHSALAAAIKKRSADAGKGGFTGDLVKKQAQTAAGKTRVIAFENFAGGAGILQLSLDEEFQLLTSNRPSTTFTGFLDWLVRDIAWGFGVSPEFIWATAGLSGPGTRMVLDDARWFFREVQEHLISSFCQPTYMWVIARGIARGEIAVPADVLDPYACAWQGPPEISVDQGNDTKFELEKLRNGCSTWERWWASQGKNGKTMVRKRIDEIADAMEYAEKRKVPFDFLIALNKGGDGGPSQANADPKKPDPNADPGKPDDSSDT